MGNPDGPWCDRNAFLHVEPLGAAGCGPFDTVGKFPREADRFVFKIRKLVEGTV
jgi:hypothetical protein